MVTEAFVKLVGRALAGIYNPTVLQVSPLIAQLGLRAEPERSSAVQLRERLRDAIEAMKPDEDVPHNRAEWLSYQVLWQGSIQLRRRYEICQDLGLSRSSYYRFRQQGIKAVATLLWEQRSGVEQADATSDEPAQTEALRIARETPRQWVDIQRLVEGVTSTIQPLCQQRGTRLEVICAPDLPSVLAHMGVLRQVLICLLLETLRHVDEHELGLTVTSHEQMLVWQIRGNWSLADAAKVQLARELVSPYEGSLVIHGDCLSVTLPTAVPKRVLIIDDDADTVRLYETYLCPAGYLVSQAGSLSELESRLAQPHPDLVIVDVLMPQWDGWDVLLRLRAWPETQHIPVVVASVLHEPELALSLGAQGVLQKPISQKQILEMVRSLLDPDSGVAPHPTAL